MGPMGPTAPRPQMGPPAPTAGAGGTTDSMYQQRLAQIRAMPEGPEKAAALEALARDYEGEESLASAQMKYGAQAAGGGGLDPLTTGGRFGTTVARSPLEHAAQGLRTYKGYKDMGEAKETMQGGSASKKQALLDMLRSAL
jgi:hypothetical protein